jgi:hypothetical protein
MPPDRTNWPRLSPPKRTSVLLRGSTYVRSCPVAIGFSSRTPALRTVLLLLGSAVAAVVLQFTAPNFFLRISLEVIGFLGLGKSAELQGAALERATFNGDILVVVAFVV